MLLRHSMILIACCLAANATFAADKALPAAGEVSEVSVTDAAGVESNAKAQSSASKTATALKENISFATKNYRPGPSSQSQLLKVMLALSGVLALILGLAWVFKQFVQPMAQSAQKIQVLSSLSLGGKEKLVLTEVNGQQILLGVTAHGISALQSFPSTAASGQQTVVPAQGLGPQSLGDQHLETQQANNPAADSFKAKISQLMQQK